MSHLSPDARILRVFYSAPGEYLLTSELCASAGLEKSALLDRLAVLYEAGYEFEFHPMLGYRIGTRPDRLVGDDILARLPENSWVREILVFEETRSTNDVVQRLGQDGAAEGLAVFAEHQTAGRGRFGRKWESDRSGGLWFSVLARPDLPQNQWSRLTLVAALAVVDGIARVTGLQTGIKWPNDVQLHGRKLSGILVENRGFLTIGIGVNVNQAALPPEIADRAASLMMAAGDPVDRCALAAAILDALGDRYRNLRDGCGRMLEEYRSRSVLLGTYVQLNGAGGRVYSGVAEEIDEDGRLGLRLESGAIQWFADGEVSSNLR